MPRGGKRDGAGRRKLKAERPEANKAIATQVLALTQRPIHIKECTCELCSWWYFLHECGDSRLKFDARKYLTDRRDGKPVQSINHMHDKPVEVNVTHTLSERFRIAMEKAEQRVRNRG